MSRRFESLIARHYLSNGELRSELYPRRRLWLALLSLLGLL